jgi:hypothetical protein
MRMLEAKTDAEAAAIAAEAANDKTVWTQNQQTKRTQMQIDGRREITELSREDKAAIEANRQRQAAAVVQDQLLNNTKLITNLQMQGKLDGAQATNLMTMTDPKQQDMLLKSAAFNTPASGVSGDTVSLLPNGPQNWDGTPWKLPGTGAGGAPQGPLNMDGTPLKMVPVEASVKTGKATRYAPVPEGKEKLDHAGRMKLADLLDNVEKKLIGEDLSPAAKKQYQAVQKAIMADLGVDTGAGPGGSPDPNAPAGEALAGETPAARSARMLRERALKR